jgi:adrenodoxin-NADP+ reductase
MLLRRSLQSQTQLTRLACLEHPLRRAPVPLTHLLQTRRNHNHHQQDVSHRPPTIAIIGSGPAGFYTAQKLLREISGTVIDMYEQLPVPFGLVRFGVAPDHPEVKNCQDTFSEVAKSTNFTFIGNVNLGHDIPLPLLAKHYDVVVFAYGASKDRELGLEGEDRPHVYSARAFVGWYNGLPEYRDLNPDLSAGENAIVVGQGNVALDVTRILLENIDILRKTDITSHALEVLAKSTIKHVRVVGRRGPLQAAFTIKEVRELMQLPDVNFKPITSTLLPTDLSTLPRPKRRLLELLKKGSPLKPAASKSWSLDFLLSPTSLDYSSSHLTGLTFTRNILTDPSSPTSAVTATSEHMSLSASTLFRSIGYKAEPLPGMSSIGAEFDQRSGTVAHDGSGRIPHVDVTENSNPKALPLLYCSGWAKRGPTGVIASTMNDAFETAEAIVHDWRAAYTSNPREQKHGWEAVREEAKDLNSVHWEGWEKIDKVEREEGAALGKPREKKGTVRGMLAAARTA